ncbi:hypothetical protein LINPERPRIM_LOCUS29598 [Linum perenne]
MEISRQLLDTNDKPVFLQDDARAEALEKVGMEVTRLPALTEKLVKELKTELQTLLLDLEGKDAQLENAKMKLNKVKQEVAKLRMLMNSKKITLLLQASTLLKKKEEQVQKLMEISRQLLDTNDKPVFLQDDARAKALEKVGMVVTRLPALTEKLVKEVVITELTE